MIPTEFILRRLNPDVNQHGIKGLEGVLTGPNGFTAVSLERDPKDPLHPCIPAGRYRLTPATMFKKGTKRALLQSVPGRFGIFIHAIEYTEQGLGCICIGRREIQDGHITGGLPLADKVYELVANNPANSFITITDDYLKEVA